MSKQIRVGSVVRGRKLVGYSVYYCPDGADPGYYGRATSLREARSMANTSPCLEKSMWGTAIAAGPQGCGVYGDAPRLEDGEFEDDEACLWFGRGGYDCAIRVWRPAV